MVAAHHRKRAQKIDSALPRSGQGRRRRCLPTADRALDIAVQTALVGQVEQHLPKCPQLIGVQPHAQRSKGSLSKRVATEWLTACTAVALQP
jgi:hypothetical protein